MRPTTVPGLTLFTRKTTVVDSNGLTREIEVIDGKDGKLYNKTTASYKGHDLVSYHSGNVANVCHKIVLARFMIEIVIRAAGYKKGDKKDLGIACPENSTYYRTLPKMATSSADFSNFPVINGLFPAFSLDDLEELGLEVMLRPGKSTCAAMGLRFPLGYIHQDSPEDERLHYRHHGGRVSFFHPALHGYKTVANKVKVLPIWAADATEESCITITNPFWFGQDDPSPIWHSFEATTDEPSMCWQLRSKTKGYLAKNATKILACIETYICDKRHVEGLRDELIRLQLETDFFSSQGIDHQFLEPLLLLDIHHASFQERIDRLLSLLQTKLFNRSFIRSLKDLHVGGGAKAKEGKATFDDPLQRTLFDCGFTFVTPKTQPASRATKTQPVATSKTQPAARATALESHRKPAAHPRLKAPPQVVQYAKGIEILEVSDDDDSVAHTAQAAHTSSARKNPDGPRKQNSVVEADAKKRQSKPPQSEPQTSSSEDLDGHNGAKQQQEHTANDQDTMSGGSNNNDRELERLRLEIELEKLKKARLDTEVRAHESERDLIQARSDARAEERRAATKTGKRDQRRDRNNNNRKRHGVAAAGKQDHCKKRQKAENDEDSSYDPNDMIVLDDDDDEHDINSDDYETESEDDVDTEPGRAAKKTGKRHQQLNRKRTVDGDSDEVYDYLVRKYARRNPTKSSGERDCLGLGNDA